MVLAFRLCEITFRLVLASSFSLMLNFASAVTLLTSQLSPIV